MKTFLLKIWQKIKLAPWTYGQPLTKTPTDEHTKVSDLFIWRNSKDIDTFFELMDLPSFFVENDDKNYVTLVIFNSDGDRLFNKKIGLIPNKRHRINISKIIEKEVKSITNIGKCGTFAVFHSKTPSVFHDMNSFISECGYVSYSYKSGELGTYVHGNLEAIGFSKDGYELLCATSILERKFYLQYELKGPAVYELGIVNPTDKRQNITCTFLSVEDSSIIAKKQASIQSKGVFLFKMFAPEGSSAHAIFDSHLVMARPLIFRTNNNMDVLHG
jgi:hypothetical protein